MAQSFRFSSQFYGIEVLTGHKVSKFTNEGIEAELVESGEKAFVPADLMVYSLGATPFADLGKKLQEKYPGKVKIAGDAESIGKVGNAIHSGFSAGFSIR